MSTMPPISFSRSAPLMSCTSSAARNCAIQERRSCRSGAVCWFVARVLTAVSIEGLRWLYPSYGVWALQVQYQPLGFATGAADHHLGVGGLLFFAEHGIAVLRDAGDHTRLAGAADAELAGIVDIDAGFEQHFENLLALGDEIFLAGARQLHPETAGCRGFDFRGEIFDVHRALRPARGRRLERRQHGFWAAAI